MPHHLSGAPGPRHLTKGEFLAGRLCHKQLWWMVHQPDSPELVPDRNDRAVMASGRLVGATARDYVPGGRLIGPAYQGTEARVAATTMLMAADTPAIYEATFTAGDLAVSTDILQRVDGGWAVIEVKSVLDSGPEHTVDAAFQALVARRSGVPVQRVEIMHFNRECRHPNLDDLFVRDDVTEAATQLEAELAAEADAQIAMLLGTEPPPREIGPHCEEGDGCPFKQRCWPELPEHHVSSVYYAGKKWWEWERQGWRLATDLPDTLKLRVEARRQIRAVRERRMVVEDGLGGALEAFAAPLAFLDFETVRLAIPVWPGCRPMQHLPVQFSCHGENGRGGYDHHEWLADGPADPRPALARHLVAACGNAQAVVAYYARFERDCLEHLAEAVPELADRLRAIAARLVDLLPVVRDHVYHPAFGGSFSLKRVLPALVPDVASYAELDIAEGETASNELARLLFHADAMVAQERAIVGEQLREYCKQDTWAMVRLLQKLRDLATVSS